VNTQPPEDPRTMTWVDKSSRYWRVERSGARWRLSVFEPATNMWRWIDDFSSKTDAIEAAREELP
jgi:hypothetical protein